MRLQEFIAENREDILREWTEFASHHTGAGESMDLDPLRDHAAAILDSIVQDLKRSQTPQEQERKSKGEAPSEDEEDPDTAAEKHGAARAESGFTLDETISEYRAIRASVVRLWTEAGGLEPDESTIRDLIRFDEAVDEALTESVHRYSRELDRLREQREAEDRRVAEEVDRKQFDFLKIVSHELRTPLNAISGYSEILRAGIHGEMSDAQKRMLSRMRQAEKHLLSIVDGILGFHRTGTGQVSYDIEELTVAEVLAGFDALIEPLANEQGVAFEMCVEPGATRGLMDRDKVRQVLLNLTSNAVRYTPEGGRVWIDHETTEDEIWLRVHDTGPGIPRGQLEAIFEPFVRLNPSFTKAPGGVGLGLAISRQLARGMDGTLEVSSEPGKGSVFSLCVPRHPEAAD